VRPEITVRRLGSADTPTLRAVLRVFAAAFEEPETYLTRQPHDEYLKRLLASETFLCVAAFSGENVVGGLAAYVLPKFEQPRTELYIYDLAVQARYRRRGIATTMIAAVQRLAAESDAHVIFVQADREDDPAIALYSKLGTREDVLHFDIPPKGAV